MIDTRKMVRSGFLAAAVFAAVASASILAHAADCLQYGSPVTLDGWLSLKPATADEVKAGAKVGHWSVKLAKPACVAADPTNAANAAIAALPRADLTVDAALDKALRGLFGKRTKVSGTLLAATQPGGAPVTLTGVRQEN